MRSKLSIIGDMANPASDLDLFHIIDGGIHCFAAGERIYLGDCIALHDDGKAYRGDPRIATHVAIESANAGQPVQCALMPGSTTGPV